MLLSEQATDNLRGPHGRPGARGYHAAKYLAFKGAHNSKCNV